MRSSPRGWFLAGLATMAMVSACRRDSGDPQWDLAVALPLAHAELTLADLVPDSLLLTTESGQLVLQLDMRLFDLGLDTLFAAPDTVLEYAYGSPFPIAVELNAGTPFPPNENSTQLSMDELELRMLRIRSGMLRFDVENHMAGAINATFSIPGSNFQGQPVSVSSTIDAAAGGVPGTAGAWYDLAWHELDLRGPQFNSVNTLTSVLQFSLAPGGPPVSIAPQDSLYARVAYHDLVPEYAKGYFGQRTLVVEPERMELDVFGGLSGYLHLEQVDASLRIRNGIGVDARVRINTLRAENSVTGNQVDLLHPITAAPLNLDRALDLGHAPQPATNSFLINSGNSNIADFVGILPDALHYALDITVSPLGDVSNGNDFFYHDSRLSADLALTVPLRLRAEDITLARTITLDLPSGALERGTLNLFTENGFPFSLHLQLSVVNAEDQVVATLPPGGTVQAGTLGQHDVVVLPTSDMLRFHADDATMALLREHKRVRVSATFNTPYPPDHVPLLAHYALGLVLTVEGDHMVNGDD